jgi:peptidoglycan L-alanyl-D-glutamate endopeptidase CwlK
MGFELSKRSNNKLNTVDSRMQYVVREAIKLTKVDFGVICGKRTEGEQRKLVESGASQTMKSKHLDGIAVDLMAYVGSRASWELNLYDDIADAMAEAARKFDIGVCWGAAWATPSDPYPMDISKWDGSMEDAMNAYVDLRRSQGRRPFIDGPHFELII